MSIDFPTPRGSVALRFRFCPAGEVVRGRPAEIPSGNTLADKLRRGRMVGAVEHFYMGETEVSQGQLRAILGEDAMAMIAERMLGGAEGTHDPALPVRGLTLFEAGKFCEKLQEFDRQAQGGVPTLEDRHFRIPTHDEWQYACRAIQDAQHAAELPQFNAWPRLQNISKDVLADCQDVWSKKLNAPAPFVGSQDQILQIIAAHDNPVRGVEILSAFLQAGLGVQRSYATAELVPQPIGSGQPNNWNITEMHGNVFEWTIAETNKDAAKKLWEALMAGDLDAAGNDEAKSFFLAGGGFNHSLDRNFADWVTFSIWGGYPMQDGAASAYSMAQIESDNIVQDMLPGLRVLLDRRLTHDWLFLVRKEAVLTPSDSLDEIQQRLIRFRANVQELATSDELEPSAGKISFYESLSVYAHGDRVNAAQRLSDASKSLAAEDSFFGYLPELVSRDAMETPVAEVVAIYTPNDQMR
ncbi:formylglycine-generating enzyme family protein [Blastopirellula marina]|uniref:formylglycine-generating enzyme family protein n=1 Tax=Blastopirellula marina TaxID=124 RepID=UPI001375D88E|nr:SUMF1/EgtB/PvdO family nonheme iron enzyme [Blastopirellula marina]